MADDWGGLLLRILVCGRFGSWSGGVLGVVSDLFGFVDDFVGGLVGFVFEILGSVRVGGFLGVGGNVVGGVLGGIESVGGSLAYGFAGGLGILGEFVDVGLVASDEEQNCGGGDEKGARVHWRIS